MHGPLTDLDERIVRTVAAFDHIDAVVELRRLGFKDLAERCEVEIVQEGIRRRLEHSPSWLTIHPTLSGGGRPPQD